MNREGLSQEEIRAAIEAIVARLSVIDSSCEGDFPLYSVGMSDRWTVSRGGSWLGGFWAGLWWLRAVYTADPADRLQARRIAVRLHRQLDGDSLHRSLIFWYSAGLGQRLFADAESEDLAARAVEALARAFDPTLACIPLGQGLGGGVAGGRSLSIDPLAASVQLFHAQGRGGLAEQQLQASLKACAGESGAWSSRGILGDAGWVAVDRPGNWSRGQAWAMLALTQAVAHHGEVWQPLALQACAYWQATRGDHSPLNRLDRPEGPWDPSAGAIACLAMTGLAQRLPEGQALHAQAARQLGCLVRSEVFTDGIFAGHCYHTADTTEQQVESACGTFFLLAALLCQAGSLDPLVL